LIKPPQVRVMTEAEVDALLARARNLPPLPEIPRSSPSAVTTSDRAGDGEQVIYGGGLIRRRGIGQVLGVR
jgi:hypothetical protein